MIVKGSRRGGDVADARELLAHLLCGAGNEVICEVTGSGATARLIDDARMLVAGERRAALWHLSLSPALPLSPEQWARAEEVIRHAYGLGDDVPLAAVEHGKPHRLGKRGGRPPRVPHMHFVFPTRDPMSSRIVNPYKHYVLNERVARQLEHELGHPMTKGRHNIVIARWAAANGMAGLAVAMDAARLLDGPAPVQPVSDAERRVAARRGADPFAPVDAAAASFTAAGQAPVSSRGAIFVQSLANEGFILARGGRLVLVPVDGGQPVGAARKARMAEGTLRELLGAELDRLPVIARGADVAVWLAALPRRAVLAARPDNVIIEGKHHGLETADGSAALGGHGRRGDPGRDAGAAGAPGNRPQGAGASQLCGPEGRRPDPADRGATRGADLAAPGGRGPDRGPAGGGGGGCGGADPARGEARRPAAATDRRRLEHARLQHGLRRTDPSGSQRIHSLTERLRAGPPPEAVDAFAERLRDRRRRALRASAEAISRCPDLDVAAEARRRAWFKTGILRRAYDIGWLPESVAENLARVDYDERRGYVTLTLKTGTRIIDDGERIALVGRTDDVSIDELVAAVERRGWDAVEVDGTHEFRRAVALRLARLEPPVTVADDPRTEVERAEIVRSRSPGPTLTPTERVTPRAAACVAGLDQAPAYRL